MPQQYQMPTWDQFQQEQRYQRGFDTMGRLGAGLLQAGAQGQGVGEGLGYGLANRGPRNDPMRDALMYGQLQEYGQKAAEREQMQALVQQLLGYDASGGWRNPGAMPGYTPPGGPGAPAGAGSKGEPARDQSGQIVSDYRPMPQGARDVSGQTGVAPRGPDMFAGMTQQQRQIAAMTLSRDPRSFGEVMSRFTAPQKAPDVVEAYDKDGKAQKHIWNAASGKYEPFGGSKSDDKAPIVHEFFNAKGQPYKAQWDSKKQDWVPVGYSKSETDKAPPTRTVHRGDKIITEEWRGGAWTEIADAPRFNPNSGITPTTTANNVDIGTSRRIVEQALAAKPPALELNIWLQQLMTPETKGGRPNPLYNADLDRHIRIGTNRMVGADPGYEGFISQLYPKPVSMGGSGMEWSGAPPAARPPSQSVLQRLLGAIQGSQPQSGSGMEWAGAPSPAPPRWPGASDDPGGSVAPGMFQAPPAQPSATSSGPPQIPRDAAGKIDGRRLMKGARYTYTDPQTGATGVYWFDGEKLILERNR